MLSHSIHVGIPKCPCNIFFFCVTSCGVTHYGTSYRHVKCDVIEPRTYFYDHLSGTSMPMPSFAVMGQASFWGESNAAFRSGWDSTAASMPCSHTAALCSNFSRGSTFYSFFYSSVGIWYHSVKAAGFSTPWTYNAFALKRHIQSGMCLFVW